MGRFLRSGTKAPATDASKRSVLSERTNDNSLMAPQKKRKPCIYKDGNLAESLPSLPEDRLDIYTFEVDKNEPKPKKTKRKRKPRKKKLDCSDSSEDDLPLVVIKRKLRSAANKSQAKRPKLQEMICNKENTGAHNLQEINQRSCSTKLSKENKENVTSRRKGTEEEKMLTLKQNCASAVCRDPTINKEKYSPQNMNSFHGFEDDGNNKENTRESEQSLGVSGTCQDPSVDHKKNSRSSGEPSIVSDPDSSVDSGRQNCHSFLVPLRKPRICQDLSEDSELNLSAIESGTEHSSPVPFHCGNFVTKRARNYKPAPATKPAPAQEFTVENYFGFNEESEDDLSLSLSPVKKVAKPIRCLPFAVSSTPYLKTTDTTTSSQPVRGVLRGVGRQPTVRQFLMSPPPPPPLSKPVASNRPDVSVLPGPSAAPPTSAAEPESTASVPKAKESPSLLFVGDDELEEFFCKPPRKSYERPVKLHRGSHSESESLSDEEVSRKKRTKRSKKSKMEDKNVAKWAANVSAQFEEIDSFQLCFE